MKTQNEEARYELEHRQRDMLHSEQLLEKFRSKPPAEACDVEAQESIVELHKEHIGDLRGQLSGRVVREMPIKAWGGLSLTIPLGREFQLPNSQERIVCYIREPDDRQT